MQDADLAPSHCCGREDCRAEVVLVDGLRAAESKEYASGLYHLEGLGVELRISAQGIVQGILVFGKCGRVEDDEVVRGDDGRLLHELEGIFGKGCMPVVARKVKLHVGIHQLHGFGTAVHGMYQLCPAPHGIDAEAASVAEHVEHLASTGIALHEGTVVALVDEEACLLSLEPVDVEGQSVLVGNVVAALAPEEAVLLSELSLEGERCLTFIIDGLELLAEDLPECFCYLMATDMHADAVSLHDCRCAIDVDDKPGQIVAFAMNQPIGVVPLPVGNADAATHLQSCGNALLPESLVDVLTSERKDAHRNAAYLPMSDGKELPVGGQHLDGVAFIQRGTALCVVYGSAEYPGMIAPETFLLALPEYYLFQFTIDIRRALLHNSQIIITCVANLSLRPSSLPARTLLSACASFPCKAGRRPTRRWLHIVVAIRSDCRLPSW